MSKNKIIVKAFLTAFCCFFLAALSNAESCSTAGQTQNKYTASGCSYTTQTRTCCSNGSWSEWDSACPTRKTCPTSSKPSTRTTCTGGYKTRTVTCDTSTGKWKTGAWSDCDCSDLAYETVYVSGRACCQRKDGTGIQCRTDANAPSWFLFCNGCCNGGYDGAMSSLSECGTCTEAMANKYPSYQCCVQSRSGIPPKTTYNGYVCQK